MKKRKIVLLILLILLVIKVFDTYTTIIEIPSVKKGRFNVSVTYELDGEEHTFNGVYVCKFDGVYITCIGSGREWSGYLENYNSQCLVPIKTNDDGVIYLSLNIIPEHCMLDPEREYYDSPEPELFLVYHSDDPDVSSYCTGEEFTLKYNAKIISFEYQTLESNEYKQKLRFGRFELTIN